MRRYVHLLIGFAVVLLFAALGLQRLWAQTSAGTAAKTWRTAFGAPDMQGMWTFVDEVMTPLQKPDDGVDLLATVEDAQKELRRRRDDGDKGIGNPEFWSELRPLTSARWLVREPDGKVPPLTPWARDAADYRRDHRYDSWVELGPFARCITRGVPGAMLPVGVTYNHSVQIVQTPDAVALHFEMFDSWLVPVDGRPHLSKDIRLWAGDPRGHWENETLVIDVTNFNGQAGPLTQFAGSEELHVVMRLTRVDADTIDFEASIDDPRVFARPWKVGLPLKRDPSYRQFEYACHEGNYAMTNTLSGARAQERAAARKGRR